jgi:hypothetical protein
MTEYSIIMETPLGSKRGTMHIDIQSSSVEGQLNILGGKNPLCGEINANGACTLRGKIKTLMREINYIAIGRVSGQTLELTVRGESNIFQITGTAYAGNEEAKT